MQGQPEIYPMPMFPTLSVADAPASVDWYVNKLGFSTVFLLPVSDSGIAMAHLRWRKYADVLLIPDSRIETLLTPGVLESRCRSWWTRQPWTRWPPKSRRAAWRSPRAR